MNQIPAEELTLSIFRESYPRELFGILKKYGSTLEEPYPGIYYVRGNVLFDTQIVVIGRLRQEAHSSLRILSKNAREEDVKTFLSKAQYLTEPGDRNNVNAILQVSILANSGLYQGIRREYRMSCDALRELMKDDIAEEVAKEVDKAVAKEVDKAVDNAFLSSIMNLMDTMKLTAEQAMDAIKIPAADRGKYAARL